MSGYSSCLPISAPSHFGEMPMAMLVSHDILREDVVSTPGGSGVSDGANQRASFAVYALTEKSHCLSPLRHPSAFIS
jgi:hypothetical protein